MDLLRRMIMSEELLLKEYIIKFFPEIDVASLTNEEKEKKDTLHFGFYRLKTAIDNLKNEIINTLRG